MKRNIVANSVTALFCAAMIARTMCTDAVAGDIAVTNLDSATHEIALSLTAPGSTTLKNGVLGLNRTGGMLAESVPPDRSWELLIWKRQSPSDPWTFSKAFTVGEMPNTPGRTTLLIRPSTNEVSQAYAVANDPRELDPLPPIPDWQDTPAPPLSSCCPPVTCCPPSTCSPQWSVAPFSVNGNCYSMYDGGYRKSHYRRIRRGR